MGSDSVPVTPTPTPTPTPAGVALAATSSFTDTEGYTFNLEVSVGLEDAAANPTYSPPGTTAAVFKGTSLVATATNTTASRALPFEGYNLSIDFVYPADSVICGDSPVQTSAIFPNGTCGITVASALIDKQNIPQGQTASATSGEFTSDVRELKGSSAFVVDGVPEAQFSDYAAVLAKPLGLAVTVTPGPSGIRIQGLCQLSVPSADSRPIIMSSADVCS